MSYLFDRSLRTAKHSLLFISIMIGSGCAAPATFSVQRELEEPDLFRDVAVAIKEHVTPEPLGIDPRPLAADPDVLHAGNKTRAPVSSGELRARQVVLRDLGIRETSDDTGFGTCPGVTVPPPSPPAVDRKKTECPQTRSFVASVGLPRAGGAYFPNGEVDEREVGKTNGHVSVRVLITSRGPEGASRTAYDFVMARDGNRWKLVKKQALSYVE